MKARTIFVAIFLLCLIAGISSVYFLFRTERAVLARFEDNTIGEVLIIAESDDRFEEWMISLCWRRYSYRMQYFLENEVPVWTSAQFLMRDSHILVLRNGALYGSLNTDTGEFHVEVEKYTYRHPSAISKNRNLFDRHSLIFPESTGWTALWSQIRNSLAH